MRTPENTLSAERARVIAVRHGGVAWGLALALLAIAVGVPRLTHADTSTASPVNQCADFACEK